MKKLTTAISLLLITGSTIAQAGINDSLNKPQSLSIFAATPQVQIYPNPAHSKITLQVKGFEPGLLIVKIIDIKGRLLRQDSRLLTSSNEDIPMFIMPGTTTCYVVAEQNGRTARKKLLLN
jgi:hypothetical protein